MLKYQAIFWFLLAALCFMLSACSNNPRFHAHSQLQDMGMFSTPELTSFDEIDAFHPLILELTKVPSIDTIVEGLTTKNVVYIGETHDNLSHHINQLLIIKKLHKKNPNLAIGMEAFQKPFQKYIDQYLDNTITEHEFLKKTEYFDRWNVDYRNYRPIIQFAQKNKIPILALDVEEEIRRKVGKLGIDKLEPTEREQIAQTIDRSNKDYRDLLNKIYSMHPHGTSQDFEHFVTTQLVRDETMAQTAAHFLKKNIDKQLIIISGGGHLVYGHGIPDRLERRLDLSTAILINSSVLEMDKEIGDYILFSKPVRLPNKGKLGVILEPGAEGGMIIVGFTHGSPAKIVGIKKHDRLIDLNGTTVQDMTDIKYVLMEKKPGEKINAKVLRKNWLGKKNKLDFEVELF